MAPTPEQLFSGRTGADALKRFEEYKAELSKSIARADEGRDFFMPVSSGGEGYIQRDARPPAGAAAQRDAQIAALERLTKSADPGMVAEMQATLDEMRGTLAKDFNASFPFSTSISVPAQLAPIDLEGPAKIVVPIETKLVNTVARENDGRGSALQYRRLLGWTNSGTGTPDLMPFMNSEFPSSQSTSNLPTFGGYANTTGGVASGGLGLRRGQKITYLSDAPSIGYVELSVSDDVSTKAYYIAQGYDDPRQLSATMLLWAHKMGEERADLYGRGSGTGYTGAVSAPTFTGAANVASASTGGTIPAGTYSVMLTAIAGGGESAPSGVVTSGAAITGTGTVTVTFPAMPSGGLGWNIWMLNAATGNFFFQASVPAGNATFVMTSYNNTGPTTANTSNVDTTANPNGYDGFLTTLLNPSLSGYVASYVASGSTSQNSVGGAVSGSTACGDTPWQTAFAALNGAATYPGNYGMNSGAPSWPWTGGTAYGKKLLSDPDVVYVDGMIRLAMGQFVRKAAGGSTAYRVTMQTSEATGGLEVGAIVNGIANQVTGKMVDFEYHPYMPPGNSFIWSKTLPMPNSHISQTVVKKNVQDYLYQQWPQYQFLYEASTYQLGTLVHYAPAWSGGITGLLP